MTDRITCQQAMLQFFAYLDRALDGQPLEALERHLQDCLDCCDRLQFSRSVDAFVKDRLGDAPLPEGLEQRLRQGFQLVRATEKG
jgi:anti-sigma factor (TIGR02949 family)